MNTIQAQSAPKSGRAAVVTGGLLWFAGVSSLAFGGSAIKSYFADFGATLSQLTVSTVRFAETLNSQALLAAGALAAVVVVTLIAAAITRHARKFGIVYLTSGLLAWCFLAATIAWPAITLQRAAG